MQIHHRKYFMLILVAFVITSAQAQKKDFYRGYIITPEADTLEGWVKDRSSGTFMKLYTRIQFKPAKGAKRKLAPEISLPTVPMASFLNQSRWLRQVSFSGSLTL